MEPEVYPVINIVYISIFTIVKKNIQMFLQATPQFLYVMLRLITYFSLPQLM